MTKPKKEWKPTITDVVPKGTKLADGTILDKETTLTQEEFTTIPLLFQTTILFMIYGLG